METWPKKHFKDIIQVKGVGRRGKLMIYFTIYFKTLKIKCIWWKRVSTSPFKIGVCSYFWYWKKKKKPECHFKNHIQIYLRANIFLGFMCNYLFVAWQSILSLANTPVMPQHLHRKITLFYWEILLSSKMPKMFRNDEDWFMSI